MERDKNVVITFEYRVIKGLFERRRYAPVFVIKKFSSDKVLLSEDVYTAYDPDHTGLNQMMSFTRDAYSAYYYGVPAGVKFPNNSWGSRISIKDARLDYTVDGFDFRADFGNGHLDIFPVKDSNMGTQVGSVLKYVDDKKVSETPLTPVEFVKEVSRRFEVLHKSITNAILETNSVDPSRSLMFACKWEIPNQ